MMTVVPSTPVSRGKEVNKVTFTIKLTVGSVSPVGAAVSWLFS